MNHRVVTTLSYLASLLNTGDDEVLISLKGNKATMTTMRDPSKVEALDLGSNPIQKIVSAITEYMCTDCIEVDYLYKDDFFIALVKSYIESLVHEFGDIVPIPFALARAILMFDLSSYKVQFQSKQIAGYWATCNKDLSNIDVLVAHEFRLVV